MGNWEGIDILTIMVILRILRVLNFIDIILNILNIHPILNLVLKGIRVSIFIHVSAYLSIHLSVDLVVLVGRLNSVISLL